jgi:hypothetical protein
MIKKLSIYICLVLFVSSCISISEKEVYFAVDSPYCDDCELIVNSENLGKLKKTDIDQFEDEDHLKNSDLLHTTLSVGTHELVVVNKKDTINHSKWTLKSDGSWFDQGLHVDLNMEKYGSGSAIKRVENSFIIEFVN